jgi:hypothetical protein
MRRRLSQDRKKRMSRVVSFAPERRRSEFRRRQNDELARILGARLRHVVSDLSLDATHANCITVTGRSKSYHGKQLATHALFTAAPGFEICNEIVVGDSPAAP